MAIATLVDKHMWLAAAVFVHQLARLNTTLPMSRVRDQARHGRLEPRDWLEPGQPNCPRHMPWR